MNAFIAFILFAALIYLIAIGPIFKLPPYGFLKKAKPPPSPPKEKEGDSCTVPTPAPKSTIYTLQEEPLACTLTQCERGYDVDGAVCKMDDNNVPTSVKDEIQQAMLTYVDETNLSNVNKTAILATSIDTFYNGYWNAGCVSTDGTIDSNCTSQFIDWCEDNPTDTPPAANGVTINCDTVTEI